MVDKKMEDLENKYYLTGRYIVAWLREFIGIQISNIIEVTVVK